MFETWIRRVEHINRLVLSVLVALCVSSMSTNVLSAETDDVGHLDDIYQLSLEELLRVRLKVASFFLEDELYVGSSVSKVVEEQWRAQGAEKTFDAIEHVPGVYVNEYFHGMMIPTFRGFTSSEQYNSFLVLLDGLPLNNYSSASAAYGTPNFALGNLQSIEVIKGPGSALYGADAFNGVVSLNSWSSDEDRYEAWVEAGLFGFWQVNGRFRHSLTDTISLTSALSAGGVGDEKISDPYHESSVSDPSRESSPDAPLRVGLMTGEYTNITTSHKLAISNFELALYYSRHDVEDAVGVDEIVLTIPLPDDEFLPVLAFPNGNHTDGIAQMLALKLSHSAAFTDKWEIDSKIYYIKDELFGRFGLGSNVGEAPIPPALEWDSQDDHVGIDVIAKKALKDSSNQMVFGANYDYIKVDHLGISVTDSGAPFVAEDESRHLLGLLGQYEHRFADDRIQLILGVRYDRYSDFGDHLSPRVALIGHPLKNSALKFLYGNAFRAPSVNEQSDNGIVRGGGDDLRPEVADTFELIWMQRQSNWRYSIGAYYSKVEDSISFFGTSNVPGFVLEFQNNRDATSVGVELDGDIRFDNWRLYGNLSWNKTRQTKPISTEAFFDAYPEIIFNQGIEYRFPNDLKVVLFNTVHEGRETLYPGPSVAPSFRDQGPLPTLWRTDLHLSWKLAIAKTDNEIYLNILDLFDREDERSSMNPVETGRNTPGFRFTVGFRVLTN